MDAPVPLIVVALLAAAGVAAPSARDAGRRDARRAGAHARRAARPHLGQLGRSSRCATAPARRPRSRSAASLAVGAAGGAVRPPPARCSRSRRWRWSRSGSRSPPAARRPTCWSRSTPCSARASLAYAVPLLRGDREADERRARVAGAGAGRHRGALRGAGDLLGELRPRAGERRVLLRPVPAAVRAAAPGARGRDRLAAQALGVVAAEAVVFAGIGFVEYATRSLLLNPKVISSNQFESYFRVNSLFFDPNIYGRFLALVMAGVAGAVLWARRRGVVLGGAALLAFLWAGLVLTFSQSLVRGAAGRAGGPRRAALVGARGGGADRRRRGGRRRDRRARARRRPAGRRRLEVRRRGDERPLRPHQGRRGPVHGRRRWSARARGPSPASTAATATPPTSARPPPRTRSR